MEDKPIPEASKEEVKEVKEEAPKQEVKEKVPKEEVKKPVSK